MMRKSIRIDETINSEEQLEEIITNLKTDFETYKKYQVEIVITIYIKDRNPVADCFDELISKGINTALAEK